MAVSSNVAESRRPFRFHAAPPCGTASRARDIPMSSTDHGPPPLRSERWPLGFPSLTGYWAGKVLSANNIYLQLCALYEYLNTVNITWSIENPARSYMWSIEDYKKLSSSGIFVVFDSCVHGRSRKKPTGLLTTLEALVALEGSCQGGHEHLEWGYTRTADGIVFDTSKEERRIPNFCVNVLLRCFRCKQVSSGWFSTQPWRSLKKIRLTYLFRWCFT